jgi:transcriptional regulator with XRE-family HTH domain
MDNILMRFCRESHRISLTKIAAFLNISIKEYQQLESGEIFLMRKQASQLGKLYKTKGTYFFKSALQLELLLIKIEIIKVQKARITYLEHTLNTQIPAKKPHKRLK